MNDNTYSDRKSQYDGKRSQSQQTARVGGHRGSSCPLGIDQLHSRALGAVISVELPDVGDPIEEGEIFAEIESVSTVHELISPVSGVVLTVNPQLEESSFDY